jgi:lipopolysaccharide/colanic/teichoic acid biosynthesis glycosyltransferase
MTRLEAYPGQEDGAVIVVAGPTSFEWSASLPEAHGLYDVSKRLIDIGLSALLLLLALPLLAIAALAVLVSTRQNPVFVQERVGLHGRTFRMLKLRTMLPARTLFEPDGPGTVLVAKAPDDPRVTRVGRVLRRTSIDELPQLLNVLRAEMSLVGPRPALPSEVAKYPEAWLRNLSVKPGLTGVWQVCGRSEVGPRGRAAMDRYYLHRRSLAYDAVILLSTIKATLSMRGAW